MKTIVDKYHILHKFDNFATDTGSVTQGFRFCLQTNINKIKSYKITSNLGKTVTLLQPNHTRFISKWKTIIHVQIGKMNESQNIMRFFSVLQKLNKNFTLHNMYKSICDLRRQIVKNSAFNLTFSETLTTKIVTMDLRAVYNTRWLTSTNG